MLRRAANYRVPGTLKWAGALSMNETGKGSLCALCEMAGRDSGGGAGRNARARRKTQVVIRERSDARIARTPGGSGAVFYATMERERWATTGY